MNRGRCRARHLLMFALAMGMVAAMVVGDVVTMGRAEPSFHDKLQLLNSETTTTRPVGAPATTGPAPLSPHGPVPVTP